MRLFYRMLVFVALSTLALIFVWGLKDYASPSYEDASWFGLGPVVWLGLGTLLAGFPLMYWWRSKDEAFFHVKPDPVALRPPPEGGDPLPQLVPEGAPRHGR